MLVSGVNYSHTFTCCTVDGRSISLGVKGKKKRKAAQQAYFKLMADGPSEKKPKPTVTTVRDLIAAFLADAETRLKPATLGMYRHHLDGFGDSLGSSSLDHITPADVSRWLAGLGVSETTKGGGLRQRNLRNTENLLGHA